MLGHMPSLAYMQQFVRSRSLRDTATLTTTCTAAVSEWAKEDVLAAPGKSLVVVQMTQEQPGSPEGERSKSPERQRKRTKRGWSDPDPASVAQLQALAAAQAQAQMQLQMQQALLAAVPGVAPVVPGAAGAIVAVPGSTAAGAESSIQRKAREIHVGNLAVGSATAEVLTELFNTALAGFVPDARITPPVKLVNLDATGRFAFVEFINDELATTAISMDRTELLGRSMTIGRPKGFVPGANNPPSNPATETVTAAQQVAAALLGRATPVVLLQGLLPAGVLRADDEREEVSEMVHEEASRCGKVLGIAVPTPPDDVADDAPCRVYVRFANADDAAKCKRMMHGRKFDDNEVVAKHATELDYKRASHGEWVEPGSMPPRPPAAPATAAAVPAVVPPMGAQAVVPPGLMAAPGLAPGLIPGVMPGSAPLSVPAMHGALVHPPL